MIIINIAAVVVAIAVVALVVSLIPLIRELKASATAVREIVFTLEADIKPTLKKVNAALDDLNTITSGAAGKIEDIQCFMSAVGETGRGLRTISTVIGTAAGALSKSSLWLTGAKVAGSFMLDRFNKKRG